jgi:uncharacterized coiled-coil protein SlyX
MARGFPVKLQGNFSAGSARRHTLIFMSKVTLMLTAAAVLLLGSSVFGFLNKGKLDARLAEIERAKLASTAAGTDAARAKDAAKKAEAARTEAESKANALQSQVTSSEAELNNLKSQVATTDQSVKAKQAEIDALNQKLAAATPPPAATPMPGVNDELDKAKHQLAELQVIKTGLESQLKNAQAAQQAAERRIAQRETNDALNGLQGRVLAVDRNWNFVVLNLGGHSGVNPNATMVIRRGNSMVGRVRITSVEPSQSIADIVPNSVPAGVSVQAGDTVVFAGGS